MERIKLEAQSVKQLGEMIGYGNMMSLASALWRQKLKESGVPESGAFVPTIIEFIKQPYKKSAELDKIIYDEIVRDL